MTTASVVRGAGRAEAARLLPRVAAATAGLGVCAFVLLSVTLERAPATFDEVQIASAARSFDSGDGGFVALYADGTANFPLPIMHGPVFYWAQGRALAMLGLSASAGRTLPLLAALLTAVAGALVVRLVGGSWIWAQIAFGLLMLSPEIGRSAAIGRMDTLAVGLALTGVVLLLAGATAVLPWRVPAFAGCGACWALAALTTPRILPLLAGLGAATALVAGRRVASGFRVAWWEVLLPVSALAAGFALWSLILGVTPFALAVSIVHGTLADPAITRPPAFGSHPWDDMVLWTGLAAAVPAFAAVWIAGIDRKCAPAPWLVLAGVSLNAALLAAALPFSAMFVPLYLGTPLQVGVTGAAAWLWTRGRLRRPLLQWGVLVIVVFAAYRGVRHVDTIQTWEARSPAALQALIRGHLARGAVVLGHEEFYYYIVEDAGARYLAPNREEPTFRAWRDAWRGPRRVIDRPSEGHVRAGFFLWPDSPPMPVPSSLACAMRHPVARYEPPVNRRSIMDLATRNAGWIALRTYPDTTLYEITPECDPLEPTAIVSVRTEEHRTSRPR